MSFISRIFKRRPGGRKFGNLLRGIAHEASYGILGNGWMMLPGENKGGSMGGDDEDTNRRHG